MDELNLIVKMKFGSHLYGTDSENSDLDYKGIFLPTERQVLLNQIPKVYNYSTKDKSGKNTKDDVDTEIFSLHYFIQLACEGQTVAMDMLHAPEEMIEHSSLIWKAIQRNRDKFYTKNLAAFIGYARRQAARYGIRGSRLNTVREILDILDSKEPETKLQEFWDELPEIEHTHKKESVKMMQDYLSAKSLWLIEHHMRFWYLILGDMRKPSKVQELLNHPWLPDLVALCRWDKLGRNPNKQIHYDRADIIDRLNKCVDIHFEKNKCLNSTN